MAACQYIPPKGRVGEGHADRPLLRGPVGGGRPAAGAGGAAEGGRACREGGGVFREGGRGRSLRL